MTVLTHQVGERPAPLFPLRRQRLSRPPVLEARSARSALACPAPSPHPLHPVGCVHQGAPQPAQQGSRHHLMQMDPMEGPLSLSPSELHQARLSGLPGPRRRSFHLQEGQQTRAQATSDPEPGCVLPRTRVVLTF